jgi:hypothetical protein
MISSKPLTPSDNKTLPNDSLSSWLVETLDSILNRVFALTHDAALLRSSVIGVLFFVIALLLIASSRSVDEWRELLGNFLSALRSPSLPLPNGDTSTDAMRKFLGAVFLNPEIWGHLVMLYAPFWLMQRIAAIYLADIFEKEEDVARQFIDQAAFGSEYHTIRIREGKIVEGDQNSPIVQIGGPGYVMVELDSAALFERPDGTPHVIGPTIGEWRSRKMIHGFERIRQAVDLREMHGSQEVTGRSRDGIPVIGKDIQYAYSIYRGEHPLKTLQTPFPFAERTVESMTYKPPRSVKLGVAPSAKHDWLSPLPAKIIGPVQVELNIFISKRGLSEFLASIGTPEEEALRSREDQLDKGGNSGEIPFKAATFTPRASITALFYNEEGFKKRAIDRGFHIDWIGVGTWVTPAEIIPANHLEAWKITRENYLRNMPETLDRLREEARLQEHLRLIQTMPITKFYNDLEKVSDPELIETLVGEYNELLLSAKELYERDGLEVPEALEKAIRALRKIRNLPPYHSLQAFG